MKEDVFLKHSKTSAWENTNWKITTKTCTQWIFSRKPEKMYSSFFLFLSAIFFGLVFLAGRSNGMRLQITVLNDDYLPTISVYLLAKTPLYSFHRVPYAMVVRCCQLQSNSSVTQEWSHVQQSLLCVNLWIWNTNFQNEKNLTYHRSRRNIDCPAVIRIPHNCTLKYNPRWMYHNSMISKNLRWFRYL